MIIFMNNESFSEVQISKIEFKSGNELVIVETNRKLIFWGFNRSNWQTVLKSH